MQNTISNPTTTKTTTAFSHFGKNKLLFANHSIYSFPKKKEDWEFISNIHIKSVDAGGVVEWKPLYRIRYVDCTKFKEEYKNEGWKLWLENEKKMDGGDVALASGIWYESFLKALSAARLNYLSLSFNDGDYKILDKTYMVFNHSKWKIGQSFCVETHFEEIPESIKYPQIKSYKKMYEYDSVNNKPISGSETIKDNPNFNRIVNGLLDGDYQNALYLAASWPHYGIADDDAELMYQASVYIDDPYKYHCKKYGIMPDAFETIQKAIATAKRLYGVGNMC